MIDSVEREEGRQARRNGKAFLSNPYPRGWAEWEEFREGWMEEDAILRGIEKSSMED